MLEALDNYDWAEAFADESSGNTTKDIAAHDVSDEPFTREDVATIIALYSESPEGCGSMDCEGVFRLKDGRYLAVVAWCDTTGWDCQAGNTLTVAATLGDAIRYGLTDNARDHLRATVFAQFAGWDSPDVLADHLEETGDQRCELLRTLTP